MKSISSKRKLSLPFKIFIGVITFCAVSVVSILLWANLDRMGGEIKITVNGEIYEIDDLKCLNGSDEDRLYYKTKNGVTKYRNHGISHNIYTYTFSVNVGDKVFTPEFKKFKSNWYKFYDDCNITFELTGEGDKWTARMVMEDEDGSRVEKNIVVGEEELSITKH